MPKVVGTSVGHDVLTDMIIGLTGQERPDDTPISWREDWAESFVGGGEWVSRITVRLPRATSFSWFSEVVKEVVELTQLSEGWDSYGGQSPSHQVASRTVRFLGTLTQHEIPRPQLTPTSRGGIQLEWHQQEMDLEVEIVSPVRARLWFEDLTTGEMAEREFLNDFSPLAAYISSVFVTE